MIIQIDNQNKYNALEIHYVFQRSYKVEAELLKATDFPPLKKTVKDFIECKSLFFGYYEEDVLAGIIEINNPKASTHIQSLVVHPDYFRKSIASNLLKYIFENINQKTFTVETGVDNLPAINLYKKFLFQEVKQWDTTHGVRKVRFKLSL